MLDLPFDPLKRARDVEKLVMKGLARKYYRFRPARYYGGIGTADRDRYYSPHEVANSSYL